MRRVPRRGSVHTKWVFLRANTNVLAAGFSSAEYAEKYRWWWQQRALGRAENFEMSPAGAPLVQPVDELRAVTSLPTRTHTHARTIFFLLLLFDSFPYYNDFRFVLSVCMNRFCNSAMIMYLHRERAVQYTDII